MFFCSALCIQHLFSNDEILPIHVFQRLKRVCLNGVLPQFKDHEKVQLFLVHDQTGDNLLHDAAGEGALGVFNFLIDNGLPVNDLNIFDQTPLHYAGMMGHVTIVERLLSMGACWHLQDHAGMTVLHYAAMKGHWDVVLLLLKHGAYDFEAYQGQTAVQLARDFRFEAVAVLIESYMAAMTIGNDVGVVFFENFEHVNFQNNVLFPAYFPNSIF